MIVTETLVTKTTALPLSDNDGESSSHTKFHSSPQDGAVSSVQTLQADTNETSNNGNEFPPSGQTGVPQPGEYSIYSTKMLIDPL